MPGKQKMIKEARESLRLLRRVGKECIDQRREAIQSGKEDTLDILTQILKGDGRKLIALWVNLSVVCFSWDLGRLILGIWTLGLSPPLMTSETCFFTLKSRTRTCFENSLFLDVGSSTGHRSPPSSPLSIPSQFHLRKNAQSRAECPDSSSWGTGSFSNLIHFSVVTALEETRDDENILDNFVTFFVAG